MNLPSLLRKTVYLISVALGIIALPVPGVKAHIGQGFLGFPAKRRSALVRRSIAGSDVAGTAVNDLIRRRNTVDRLKGIDHIQNTAAAVQQLHAGVRPDISGKYS